MATESIFHNFTITDPKAIKRFIKALEVSVNRRPKQGKRKSTLVTSPIQIREFFDKKH